MKKLFFTICLAFVSLNAMATNDTISLATDEYGIDDVQANYYTVAGESYYTFIISNFNDEIPSLRFETPASSKTQIQGTRDVIMTTNLSSLTLLVDEEETELTFTDALFWLKFVDTNNDGDAVYDIVAIVNASDGNIYSYKGRLPIYAYDYDDLDEFDMPNYIVLQDEVDDSIVEPDTDSGDTTAIDNIKTSESANTIKYIDDCGNVRIVLPDGRVYNIVGASVK